MAKKQRSASRSISIEQYRRSLSDPLYMELRNLLELLPNAKFIQITVIEPYEDDSNSNDASYDYTEGGSW